MASFGHFSEDGTEYVVLSPLDPPRHLVNFSWNDRLISGVNQFGSGEGVFNNQTLLYNDPRGRVRMVRDGRRYIYVKDAGSGAYWTIGHLPVRHEPHRLTTVFGAGYSRFLHSTEAIEADALCFVAPDEPVEVWRLGFTNRSSRSRRLLVFPYVEWLLQGYAMASDYYSYLASAYCEDVNAVVSLNTSDERPHDRYGGFVCSSIAPVGYAGSVREFLGTYGDVTRPEAVLRGACPSCPTCNENLAGALQVPLDLPPGDSRELTVLVGNTSGVPDAARLITRVLGGNYLTEAFDALRAQRRTMYQRVVITTPEPRTNHLMNSWAKNQISLCAEFGRDGVRGFRDTLQDAWAVAAFNPALARDKILESLVHQNSDGSTLRGWMPLATKHYSDGPAWIVPAIADYIKYTGDTAFLDASAAYFDGGAGTVLDHMVAALRQLGEQRGSHGLCLAFQGDWNDSLDWMGQAGLGESVMTSMAFYHALTTFLELLGELRPGSAGLAEEMRANRDLIRTAIETGAWDGQWYLQGYADSGDPVGSSRSTQGQIFLAPQAWAIYSGVASAEHCRTSLQAVEDRLRCETGCTMCAPVFTTRDDNVGRLTVIQPGMYENGSAYCHGSAFMIAAYLAAGLPNEAMRLYRQVMPDDDLNPSDVSGAEPYAFTNQYLGPDSLRAGASITGWITGTAGWMHRILVNHVFGLQPGYRGVHIRPCIPDDWDTARLEAKVRGTVYRLRIRRRPGASDRMTVNGAPTDERFVPYGRDESVDIEYACGQGGRQS